MGDSTPSRTDSMYAAQPEDNVISPHENDGLSDAELQAQAGEELPDREAMSLIDANIAAPVNAAVAANILSDNSVAYANAEQTVDIDQSN